MAPPLRRKFTGSEVQQMLDIEIFAVQRFELIDGDLFDSRVPCVSARSSA